jgi:cytidylate kinase
MSAPITVAVDGPAASGKGTIARAIAREYNLPHLDSGLLYRGLAFVSILRRLERPEQSAAFAADLNEELLANPRLRDDDVSVKASVISQDPSVRAVLRDRQLAFAASPGGAVIDGRDIGTVIMPHATAKLFITASPEERAYRRHKQLLAERGRSLPYESVLEAIIARDTTDSSRALSPLRVAPGAFHVDTTSFSEEEAISIALSYVRSQVLVIA